MADMSFKDFSDFLKNKASNINDKLEKTIKLCCKKVSDDIQYGMAHTPLDMSKSYYSNNKTKVHHPSLPGNPPAIDTGNLRESIRFEVHNETKKVYGIVGSSQMDEDYAVYMEYGTSKIAPRPWLRPAMEKNNDWIRSSIAKAVANTFKENEK